MLIHVAIVSDQFLPTVIPALMHQPQLVVLVASQPMAAKAERLRRVLEAEGCAVDLRDQAPDAGLDCIRAYAAHLAEDLRERWSDAQFVFNATGGNKLMTLGFVEVFRDRADRIIYTDTTHGRIEVIHDRDTQGAQPESMHDVLDVPRYLAVQGFRYSGSVSDDASRMARIQARGEIAKVLAHQAARSGGFIGFINGVAHRAMDEQGHELVQPVQRLNEALHGEWRALFDQFAQAGLLKPERTRVVRFSDLDSARFLGGGWLEEYAFMRARDAGLFDVRMGVTGVWEGATSAKNEFDVLACHRNRMLFVECKTLRWNRHQDHDNDVAYKVKSLGEDVRGLLGDTWVLAAQEPSPILRDRAKQAGFQVLSPRGLSTLTGWLNLWKQGQS
jgi:hypothetical protein